MGIHVESFDPEVLARVAPAKARTGIERYFETWEHAVERFGEGQVSTYVILGMGEDPELTVDGCKRAIDIGVYPFIVPLRPVAGSLMEDGPRRSRVHPADLPRGRELHGAAACTASTKAGVHGARRAPGSARCSVLQIGRRPELAGSR